MNKIPSLILFFAILAPFRGCGEKLKVAPKLTGCNGTTIVFAAHEDDDILFFYPDLQSDFSEGRCLVSVYLTAGQARHSLDYAFDREEGVRAAHAYMADVQDEWEPFVSIVHGRSIPTFALKDRPNIVFLFMRFPDGNTDGKGFPEFNNDSLQKLYYGDIHDTAPIDNASETYSKTDLISTLSEVIDFYRPDTMRIPDLVTELSADHSDHVMTAYFAYDAQRLSSHPPKKIVSYADYKISKYPINLSDEEIEKKEQVFFSYAKHDMETCQTVESCGNEGNGNYLKWFERQYQVDIDQ